MIIGGNTGANHPSPDVERPLSAKENAIWNSAGNFIYLLSQWLLTYAVVRMLGYESAGIFSLAISIGTSFSTVALYSMRNYQVSDIEDEHSTRTYLSSRHVTCGASFFACLAFSVANHYNPYTLLCITAFMLFKTSEALSDAFQGIMQKKYRMDYIGISLGIKSVVELALFCAILALIGDLLVAIIVLAIASYAVIALYDHRTALKNVALGTTSISKVKSLLIACLPIAIYGFLFNTAIQVPRYFIENIMGAEQLGYYTSIAMPVVIVQVFATFVFAPLVTPMAQYLGDEKVGEFIILLKKALLAILVISALAFIGFGLLGEWGLELLFGESITPYAYLLTPLIICTILTALSLFLSAVLTVLRKLYPLLVFSAVSFGIVAIGSAPVIQAFGLNGANYILIASLAFFVIACSTYICYALRSIRRERAK